MKKLQIPDEIEENIQIYEEVVQNICNLFIKLGFRNNAIKIYENFRYMYMNGYLSVEKKYSENLPESHILLELRGFVPIDIEGSILMTNYGVCRHTADFLSHIYDNLEFDNSQLFTYHPNLHIEFFNLGQEFLTNYDAQKYIDEALENVNLFAKDELHFVEGYGKVELKIDYLPPTSKSLMNHVLNIVKSKKDETVHILDTRYHCIGEKMNDAVLLDDLGLKHKDFVQDDLDFNVYYNRTNYDRGLELLNYATNLKRDVLDSIFCRHDCENYKKDYEEFWENNFKNFVRVSNNVNSLIKRM